MPPSIPSTSPNPAQEHTRGATANHGGGGGGGGNHGGDNDDDDNISLTSTIGNDSREGHVEEILAKQAFYERDYYLVKWEGFPLEQATWEPIESFSDPDAAAKSWEHTKAAIERGDKQSVDLILLQRKAIEAIKVREARRKRRREKRARLAINRVAVWSMKVESESESNENRSSNPTTSVSNVVLPVPATSMPSTSTEVATTAADTANGTSTRHMSPTSAAALAVREGRYGNPHAAARAFGAEYNAVRSRLGLNKPTVVPRPLLDDSPFRNRKMTREEEQEVVDYFLARRDNPPPRTEIVSKATEVLRRRKPHESFSTSWADLFLQRHKDVAALYPKSGTKRRSLMSIENRSNSPSSSTPQSLENKRVRPNTRSSVLQEHEPEPEPEGEPEPANATSPASTEQRSTIAALAPGPDVMRLKVRTDRETRYLLAGINTTMEEFKNRVRAKLGLAGNFKLQVEDDGDMVTIGDQEDLNIILALAKEGPAAEVWVKQ